MLPRILTMLYPQDPVQAISLAAALPHASERRALLAYLLLNVDSHLDIEAAYKKLAAFPSEDREYLEGKIQRAIVPSLLANHREDAVKRLAAMPPEEAAPLTLEHFSSWAQTDPIRAAPHLAKLPESLKTEALYNNFAEIWVEGNVGMASQWVKDLPDGKIKDAAIQGLAGGLAKNFPEEAMVWAASVKEEAGRLSAIQNVITRAAPEAQATVMDSLNRLYLSPEARAALRFPPPP